MMELPKCWNEPAYPVHPDSPDSAWDGITIGQWATVEVASGWMGDPNMGQSPYELGDHAAMYAAAALLAAERAGQEADDGRNGERSETI